MKPRSKDFHRFLLTLIIALSTLFGMIHNRPSGPARAQNEKKLEDIKRKTEEGTRRFEALLRKLVACGYDCDCAERVNQEMKQLVRDFFDPNNQDLPQLPGYQRVLCKMKIVNRTELRYMDRITAKSDGWGCPPQTQTLIAQYYLLEYEAQEDCHRRRLNKIAPPGLYVMRLSAAQPKSLERRVEKLQLLALEDMRASVIAFYSRVRSRSGRWHPEQYPTGTEKELYAQFAHILLSGPTDTIPALLALFNTSIAKRLKPQTQAGTWSAYRVSTRRRDLGTRGKQIRGPLMFPGGSGRGGIADVVLLLNPRIGQREQQIHADLDFLAEQRVPRARCVAPPPPLFQVRVFSVEELV